MYAFRDGRVTHEYVSDQAMLVDWFIDDDDTTKFRLDGLEYPGDAPYPRGPRGADAAMLARFGVGQVDLDRLGAALRGEFDGGASLYAEFQHRLILKAMNLDPQGLTTAFRWARLEELPGPVRVPEVRQRPDESHGQTITVVIETGLPLDADPLEAGQVIA